jgi:hypothetical protein
MVRFAPHLAPLLLVREQLLLADDYQPTGRCGPADERGLADADRTASDDSQTDSTTAPSPSLSDDADRPVADGHRPADEATVSDPLEGATVSDSSSGAPVPDPLDEAAAPVPDPFDDVDALEELEEEITTLAAHIHAATHRLLTLIAEFDRRRGWELGGHRTCAHWLHARTGIDLGAAREKVRAARALVSLPEISASMARGQLSFSKVRALSRVANAANEGDLLELARDCTTAQLEHMVRAVRRGGRKDEAALERARHESRTLSVFPDDDGMYVVRGRLSAEVGALLMRAVEAASDALYREKREPWQEAESERAGAQRRADALGLLAERALAAGFGGKSGDGEKGGSGAEPAVANDTENGAETDAEKKIPISGSRAERYQVVLHVEPDTLTAEGEPGRSELEDGTRVSAETSARLSCDAGLVVVSHGPDGSILDVGRRTRTIPAALRRALEYRDRGCRFPGCGLRFTDGHHLTHWAAGGETSLSNCLLLCRFHHRLVHEGGWQVDWWGPGRAVFYDPRGRIHFEGRWQWPAGAPEEDSASGPSRSLMEAGERPGEGPAENPVAADESLVETLVEENRLRGVEPDGWTANARWKREDDIPNEIYFRALEAMYDDEP